MDIFPKTTPSTFYSRCFTSSERRALDSLPFDDLSPEIKLFRVLLVRLLSSEKAAEGALTLENRIAGLRAVSHATSTLGSLVRAQLASNNPMSEFEEAILQAIDQIHKEFGLNRLYE